MKGWFLAETVLAVLDTVLARDDTFGSARRGSLVGNRRGWVGGGEAALVEDRYQTSMSNGFGYTAPRMLAGVRCCRGGKSHGSGTKRGKVKPL